MKKYKRILLKLSGEALMGANQYGISQETLHNIVKEIKTAIEPDIQLAVVIGGGNIFRGINSANIGVDRATADYMGMLATIMNALAFQSAMKEIGLTAHVQSALKIEQVAEPYIRNKSIRHLEKNRVVIFSAGTGNPYFTTDTAAVLRGLEIDADIIIKATKVDGIYTADPKVDKNAKLLRCITFDEAIEKQYKIMDATAFTLCRDQKKPIAVLSVFKPDALRRFLNGEEEGTLVLP